MGFSNQAVGNHFDNLALRYGRGIAKNYYNLKVYELIRGFIANPSSSSVLDIGCGNGDFLRWLNPKKGIGIDLSQRLIDIANHVPASNLRFEVKDVNEVNPNTNFDYIVLIDVIEHLSDLSATVKSIKKLSSPNTRIIMSFPNPLWEIPFRIFEALGIKDPEGPHNLTSLKKMKGILRKNGFGIIKSGYRLLIPLKIPLLSSFFNSFFYKIPILANFGMSQFIVCRLTKTL